MQKERIKHRGARVGDMHDRILIMDRSIESPLDGQVDFRELFDSQAIWAGVKTLRGKTVFDGVGDEYSITHEIRIRYRDDVAAQTFIQLDDGRRLKVIFAEDLNEEGEYLFLSCTDRGLNKASYA